MSATASVEKNATRVWRHLGTEAPMLPDERQARLALAIMLEHGVAEDGEAIIVSGESGEFDIAIRDEVDTLQAAGIVRAIYSVFEEAEIPDALLVRLEAQAAAKAAEIED